jgi:putative membrane protein
MFWGHMTGGGWLLMSVFWLLLVALAAFTVVRILAGRPPVMDDTVRARGILAERFARGEIGTEEYRERLEELGQHRLPSGS